jgi:predicted pyridoxine 5'-phosphate oxidase superfamily flavin-nucleotide-binding protein
MIDLSDEMANAINHALADGTPCLMGTASAQGLPDISYRGSVMVFDREHLAYWERAKNIAVHNIESNPNVEILYRNRDRGLSWRFWGRATVYEMGPIRDQIMARTVEAELQRDPERKGFGVLIEVDIVTDGAGQVLQERTPGAGAVLRAAPRPASA